MIREELRPVTEDMRGVITALLLLTSELDLTKLLQLLGLSLVSLPPGSTIVIKS